MTRRQIIVVALGALLASGTVTASEYAADADAGTLASIARDIEGLKKGYPQLAEFSTESNLDAAGLTISYAYRTHEPKRTGGWTSGVPNPDEDGIWFHLDFHDPASTAQIHTQPMSTSRQCLADKVVGFLILEGPKTNSVNDAIWLILRKHGVAECPDHQTDK